MKSAAAILTLAGLTGCVPWTVRPIDRGGKGAAGERFDAGRYVDSVWEAKLLPAIDHAAVDLKAALAPGSLKAGSHVAVRGTARILRVNTTSQSGALLLDLPPGDGRADAVLQIGPELRGSSLRDATSAIGFSQFLNQIDFANAGSELNRRAVRALPPRAELERSAGRQVAFTGAFTVGQGALPEIVPARFGWVEDRK